VIHGASTVHAPRGPNPRGSAGTALPPGVCGGGQGLAGPQSCAPRLSRQRRAIALRAHRVRGGYLPTLLLSGYGAVWEYRRRGGRHTRWGWECKPGAGHQVRARTRQTAARAEGDRAAQGTGRMRRSRIRSAGPSPVPPWAEKAGNEKSSTEQASPRARPGQHSSAFCGRVGYGGCGCWYMGTASATGIAFAA